MSHWYAQDGSPCYELPKRGGGTKAVTLREARQLHLNPSTTTVLEIVAKKNIEDWKVKQGIIAALTLEFYPGESDEEYIERCIIESRRKAKEAAEEGTRIHDAIEASFKGKTFPEYYRPHVQSVQEEIRRLFPDITDWFAEESFAHPDGFGGKCDLHSRSAGIVVDYKGKDGDFTDGKKLAYDQHWQLGSYRRGLRLPPGGKGANIFVSRTHPGKVASHVWSPQEIDEGEAIFMDALSLWKKLKKYDGGWDEAD